VRALYGLQSAGAGFGNHITECTHHLGLKSCHADHDIWMKVETRPNDGMLYWAYILIHPGDILCVHHDPGTSPDKPPAKLDEYSKMKEGYIQVPTF
jgi:hypothetical protein